VRRLVLLAVVAGSAAAVFAGSVPARQADSAAILPWHQIGDANLNTSRATVVARYGSFSGDLAVHQVASGGELDVSLARNRVVNVSTSSARYRTADGIGVGVVTPAGTQAHWKGFTFRKDFNAWEKVVCYAGVHTTVDLDVEQGVIRRVGIGFSAGVCPGLTPKEPLTAADRAAITTAIQKAAKPAKVKASQFKVAIDNKQWASVLVTGKDPNGFPIQPAIAVLHHGSTWTVVDVGTSGVGCTKVPIKPLTQIGSTCPG